MQLHGIDYAFWIAGFVGHVVLVGVLFVRRRAKSFPVFTAWMIFNVLRNVVLYSVFRYAKGSYFTAFWTLGVLDVILQTGVFFELTKKVFCPLGTWAPDVKRGLQLVVAGSVMVALALTLMEHPVSHRLLGVLVMRGNFFSSALLSELFLGTLILSSWAGLPWRTHVARISLVLGGFAALGIVTQAAQSVPGMSLLAGNFFWSHLEIACYLGGLGFWIVTLWQEAEAPRELPDKIRQELAHLNRLLDAGSWRR